MESTLDPQFLEGNGLSELGKLYLLDRLGRPDHLVLRRVLGRHITPKYAEGLFIRMFGTLDLGLPPKSQASAYDAFVSEYQHGRFTHLTDYIVLIYNRYGLRINKEDLFRWRIPT